MPGGRTLSTLTSGGRTRRIRRPVTTLLRSGSTLRTAHTTAAASIALAATGVATLARPIRWCPSRRALLTLDNASGTTSTACLFTRRTLCGRPVR
ncbi:hypothetical protein [Nocardia sp. NPDC003979]